MPKGRKVAVRSILYPKIDDEKKNLLKARMLMLLEQESVNTLADAAHSCGILATTAYKWRQDDENFRSALELIKEVLADANEAYLQSSKNVVAHIFLLKGRRREFKDNYKEGETNTKLEKLLEELKKTASATKEAAIDVKPTEKSDEIMPAIGQPTP